MLDDFSINDFDALDWINNYIDLSTRICPTSFEPILHFSLMWNIFESNACRKSATPAAIKSAVNTAFSSGIFDGVNFTEYLEFFRNYARRNGSDLDGFFEHLIMTQDDHKKVVRKVFEGSLLETNDIVYALLLIAHRVRNNLFHGNKEIGYLHTQIDLFRSINSLLAKYLSLTKNA